MSKTYMFDALPPFEEPYLCL